MLANNIISVTIIILALVIFGCVVHLFWSVANFSQLAIALRLKLLVMCRKENKYHVPLEAFDLLHLSKHVFDIYAC